MASLEVLKAEVLEPQQRLWNPPFGTDEDTRRVRLEALAENLKAYSEDHLRKAREYLVRTHKGTWPQVPEWLKAIRETTGIAPKSEQKNMPWIARGVAARREFRSNFSDTALARMARAEGWWMEYESSMTRLIWEALRDSADLNHISLGDELVTFFRKKGRANADAADYRKTPEYQRIHGVPYKHPKGQAA
ncbi:MAG: hypothetical protein JJ939_12165 [Alphaproteobacteria bacterium]|nr:hypothetical protein [Alphaproteobacteria bacterium]MBO6629168.1 hypothetical protein [Alphaproteobacteria bacterium]